MTQYKIDRVLNGWTCTLVDEGEDEAETQTVVGLDNDECEVSNFINFLRSINEHFGPTTSRYSKKRIRIRDIPGDRYEPLSPEDKEGLKDDLYELSTYLGIDKSIAFLQGILDKDAAQEGRCQ